MRILALDQGTTSTRAISVDQSGRTQTHCAIEHRQFYPQPGWVEHDPLELLGNIETCLSRAQGDFAAVGIANQGESCLAWNRQTGEPVSPVIVWQDERTAPENDRLRSEGAEDLTLARAGLPLDAYFSASKLGWIVRNIPQAGRLAAAGQLCLGTTDAFFRHRLTGRFETDVATASRTSLMDLAGCCWDDALCDLFGVPMDCLPDITATSGSLGEIAGTSLPLAASIVDQQAALRGHGCQKPGDAKITFGTGAFVLAVAGPDVPGFHTGILPTVAWRQPDAHHPSGGATVYALEGGVHSAAAAINWARRLGLFADWADIDAFDKPPAISRGLAFVPALTGLAAPHWDRQARGTWMGLGIDTDRSDLVQAILEGIAFRSAEVIAAMQTAIPVTSTISVDGGMTRNRWFCQFLADCLGREVRISAETERTAMGTAFLAAEAIGVEIPAPADFTALAPHGQPDQWAALFGEAVAHARAFGQAH
ncbi:MAG: FGGY family carbohydrate kinase [Marinibacterium sp.]